MFSSFLMKKCACLLINWQCSPVDGEVVCAIYIGQQFFPRWRESMCAIIYTAFFPRWWESMYAVIYTVFFPVERKVCTLLFTLFFFPVDGKVCTLLFTLLFPPVDGKVCMLLFTLPFSPVDGKVYVPLFTRQFFPRWWESVRPLFTWRCSILGIVSLWMVKCAAIVSWQFFPCWWESVCQCHTQQFSPLMEMSVYFGYKYPHGDGYCHPPGGPFPTIDGGGVASVHSVTMCLWSYVNTLCLNWTILRVECCPCPHAMGLAKPVTINSRGFIFWAAQ